MEKEPKFDQETQRSTSEMETRTENREGDINVESSTSQEIEQVERQVSVDVESVVVEVRENRDGSTNVIVLSEDLGEGESTKDSKPIRSEAIDEYNPVLRLQIRVLHNVWAASRDTLNLFPKATVLIFTVFWMLFCGGIPLVSIAMVIIGSIFMDDCNAEPKIPLYLVVGGVCGAVRHVFVLCMLCLPHEWQIHRKEFRHCLTFFNSSVIIFQFAWFICGCVWTYSIQEMNYQDTSSEDYCDKTVYYFTFWLLSLYLLFTVIGIVMVLTFCCILCIVSACLSY